MGVRSGPRLRSPACGHSVQALGAPLLHGRCEGVGEQGDHRPELRLQLIKAEARAHSARANPHAALPTCGEKSRGGRTKAETRAEVGGRSELGLGRSPLHRREEGGIYEMSISFLIKNQPRVFLITCHSDACEQAPPALATLGNSVPCAGGRGQLIGLEQEGPQGLTDRQTGRGLS